MEASSLGLDLERDGNVAGDLEGLICTAREREWLAAKPPAARDRLRTLFFSAKEAVYKCQYPVTRRGLDFRDLELEVDPEAGRFQVRPAVADAQLSDITRRMACRMMWSRGFVVTGVRL